MTDLKAAVLGLGLIGASMAWALQEKGFFKEIWGYDIKDKTLDYALEKKIIDQKGSIKECAQNCNLLIIAVPATKIPQVIQEIAPYLQQETIVTDVGSSKKWVLSQLEAVKNSKMIFIGGHPMAGSQKAGIDAADPNLFQQAPYFLITDENTDPKAIAILQAMIKALGAIPHFIKAQAHDALVSRISHFPYLVATALTLACGDFPGTEDFAAGGFRDTTRIAACDIEMAGDFCLTNQEELLITLNAFSQELQNLIEAFADEKTFKEKLSRAKAIRDQLAQKKGWEG